MKARDKAYYTRLIMGVIAGLVCGLFKLVTLTGFYVGMLFLVLSYYVLRFILRLKPGEVEGRVFYREGVGTYIITWLLVWSLTYSMLLLR